MGQGESRMNTGRSQCWWWRALGMSTVLVCVMPAVSIQHRDAGMEMGDRLPGLFYSH